jgi:hypothetical protein
MALEDLGLPTAFGRADAPAPAGGGAAPTGRQSQLRPYAVGTAAGRPRSTPPVLPSVGRAGVGLAFGADYYPEQWPAATWQQDIELMSSTGVNVVRIGTFCWCHVEPEEGRFEFGWLDEVLELLRAAGIAVILATPTASPPPWCEK